MSNTLLKQKANFGTAPVFMTAISTILGAILYLRFGYAVAHTGFMGAIAIIIIGHLVTIPTAMAVAEIATNRKVPLHFMHTAFIHAISICPDLKDGPKERTFV